MITSGIRKGFSLNLEKRIPSKSTSVYSQISIVPKSIKRNPNNCPKESHALIPTTPLSAPFSSLIRKQVEKLLIAPLHLGVMVTICDLPLRSLSGWVDWACFGITGLSLEPVCVWKEAVSSEGKWLRQTSRKCSG